MAILAALILGVVGFLAFGAGAAIWMRSIYGSNSGGTEMSSFFTFGPAGGVVGILLGLGLVFRLTGGPAGWAKGLLISAASLTGLAVLILSGLALAHTKPAPTPPPFILVFQVELPAAAVAENISQSASWSIAGGSISSLNKNCSGDTCTFGLVISMDQTFSGGTLALAGAAAEFRFPVDPSGLHQTSDWCDWRSSGAARFRYRVSRD